MTEWKIWGWLKNILLMYIFFVLFNNSIASHYFIQYYCNNRNTQWTFQLYLFDLIFLITLSFHKPKKITPSIQLCSFTNYTAQFPYFVGNCFSLMYFIKGTGQIHVYKLNIEIWQYIFKLHGHKRFIYSCTNCDFLSTS